MRVLAISIVSIFAVALILFTARLWGSGQTFVPYQHIFFDFLKTPQTIVKYRHFEDLKKSPMHEALYVDLMISRDGVFAVNFNPELQSLQGHDSTNWPASVVSMKDFLPILDDHCVILNVADNLGGIHNHLQKMLGDLKIKESSCLAITSETESVVKSSKEILPRFLYGSSRAEIMTMLSMQSMYILPAFRIRSDFLISPLKSRSQYVMVNNGLIEEAHRQFKKFIIGPLETEVDIEQAKAFKPDAVIVVR